MEENAIFRFRNFIHFIKPMKVRKYIVSLGVLRVIKIR